MRCTNSEGEVSQRLLLKAFLEPAFSAELQAMVSCFVVAVILNCVNEWTEACVGKCTPVVDDRSQIGRVLEIFDDDKRH